METIKVNMNPNPLDVQTIHASQNDGEARQWEFELHNNGELIDTSEVTEQLFFKAYKGGTEQILPTNGSVPVTAPFLGDIRYPQGLLTDQEFTYRQSPTEEDGLAKITDIKGNTLVWNQLVPIGETSKSMTVAGVTVTDNRDGSYTFNGTATATQYLWLYNRQAIPSFIKPNHKYLMRSLTSDPAKIRMQFILYGTTPFIREETGGNILTTPSDFSSYTDFGLVIVFINGNTFTNEKLYPILMDLTAMGLDSLTDAEILQWFADYFPLSYYSYNQGSLLSFNGNGIKTVGKNQSQLVSMTTISGGYINASSGEIATVKKGITYTLSFDNLTSSTSNIVARIQVNGTWIRQGENNLVANSRWALTFTATDDGVLGLSAGLGSQYSEVKVFDNIQLEFGSTATDYEPYTSSTLSLPISTYFPTGMKSAGNVYDELTENKAITRIGEIDFGPLTWRYDADYQLWVSTSGITNSNQGCLLNANIPYQSIGLSDTSKLGSKINNTYNIWVRNGSNTIQPSGIAYYILASSTETSFNTASLVTENAEIPLSNNDGVLIGKCTEELSAEPGFHDAKIKLSDSDGTCYSNKIQLHVERKPS